MLSSAMGPKTSHHHFRELQQLTLLTVFLAFSSSERTGDGLEGAVVAGAGDAEEDGQHDEAVVGGEENDEEENLESHANVINDSQVH